MSTTCTAIAQLYVKSWNNIVQSIRLLDFANFRIFIYSLNKHNLVSIKLEITLLGMYIT